MNDGNETARAAARGVIAAMAMTGMRTVTRGLGLIKRPPPEQIAEETVPGLMALIPRNLRDEAVELAHWTYGGIGAVAYELLPGRVRRLVWAGPLYGLATWAFFEAALAPLLGLRHVQEATLVERAAFAADHALYGVVVASSPWPHEPNGRRS